VIVSASALLYVMGLMPLYIKLSPEYRVLWRVFAHSAYFEIVMMVPVRYFVSKQLRDNDVLKALAVVHAQAHVSSIGRLMLSGVGDLQLVTVTILLVNFGRFLFRSTGLMRDRLMNAVMRRNKVADAEEAEEAFRYTQFVRAVSLHVDIIMENSTILLAAFTLYAFQDSQIFFMLPFSATKLTFFMALASAFIQYAIGSMFDYAALYTGARFFHMPIAESWEQMKKASGRFFGFLVYGVLTMGMLGTLYMCVCVPRPIWCTTDDMCTCSFVPYQCAST